MTQQELTGLTDDCDTAFPMMVYPPEYGYCGDFRSGATDWFLLEFSLMVFDSLKVDGQHKRGFVDSLHQMGGVRLGYLGTTTGAKVVFQSGGHIYDPDLEDPASWQMTEECHEFGQPV